MNVENNKKGYTLNQYLWEKLSNETYLVTCHPNGFSYLTKEEFNLLRNNEVEKNQELFNRLKEQGIVITNENFNKVADSYTEKFWPLFNGTSLHIMAITANCPNKCVYCHAEAKPMHEKNNNMTTKTAEKVVDFIFQTPAKNITIEFQGGEPLANFPIIKHTVNYTKEKNKKYKKIVNWNMVTNLTLMKDETAEFCKKNSINIATSFDGPKQVHDKNRSLFGGGGTYNKVTYWVKRLRENYNMPRIGLLPTITRHTLPYAKELVDEYLNLGAEDIRPVLLRKLGFARNIWGEIGYTSVEFLDFWKKVLNICIDYTKEGTYISEQHSLIILKKFVSKFPAHYSCFSSPCGAALMQSSYNWKGEVFTCDEARSNPIFKLGDVEKSYKEIYTAPNSLNMVQTSSSLGTLCNACAFSPFCGTCPVTTYALQGNTLSKLAFDFECKIKKGQMRTVFEKYDSKDKEILQKWIERGQRI